MSPAPIITPSDLSRGWRAWSEATWQHELVKFAEQLGWTYYHPYRSYKSPTGFPDLVLCKRGARVIFAELKTESKASKPTASQVEWLDRLRDANAEVYLWRPRHLNEIARILRAPGKPYPGQLDSAWR